MKMDLLTNAAVVDDAIRFVSQKSEQRVESTDSSNEDVKESRQPDYDDNNVNCRDNKEKQEGMGMLTYS
jgi:hypothetical protein